MPLTHTQPDALARIYALSLFDLAKEDQGRNRTEEVLGELEDILEIARSDARFSEFLASLILPRHDRARSLDAMLKGRVSDLTLKFLQVVNAKERLGHLPAIVAALDQLVQNAYGRVEVDVYTASPIGAEELNDVRTRLHQMLGKEPVLHAYTDASLIGGIRLQIGDQLIDASVQSQLRKLRDRVNQNGGAAIRAAARGMVE